MLRSLRLLVTFATLLAPAALFGAAPTSVEEYLVSGVDASQISWIPAS